MRLGFRNADPRFGFFWEDTSQPPGRWHGPGEGPVQYLADTPDGAWAEFLRHEEIVDPVDLTGVERALWAVQVEANEIDAAVELPLPTDTGLSSYPRCQEAARAARGEGATAIRASSAALRASTAAGWRCAGGLVDGAPRDGQVWVLFGPRPNLPGWRCVEAGRPSADVLGRVQPLS